MSLGRLGRRGRAGRPGRLTAVVAVIGVTVATLAGCGGDDGANSAPPAGGYHFVVPAASLTTTSFALAIGPSDAAHRVVVYEDFLCPYCKDLEDALDGRLVRLAEQGEILLEYHPYQLLVQQYSGDATSVFAAVMNSGAAESVALRFHDLLLAHQPPEDGPFPTRDRLVDLAVQAGADHDRVEDALADTASIRSWLTGAAEQARAADVVGAPTVILDGERFDGGTTQSEIAESLLDALS